MYSAFIAQLGAIRFSRSARNAAEQERHLYSRQAREGRVLKLRPHVCCYTLACTVRQCEILVVKNALAKCVLRDGGRQWQRCFAKCKERLSEANNSADRERFCM